MSTPSRIILKLDKKDLGHFKKFDSSKLPLPYAEWIDKDENGKVYNDESCENKCKKVKLQGEYIAVYCHWNGYPSDTGRALRKHFKDYDAILNLLLGGFISIISNGYVKHYANRQSMKWENSREYEGCKPIQGSLDELRKSIYGQFEYIFEDGKWKSYDGLTHKPL
jgi:hypothetical protein